MSLLLPEEFPRIYGRRKGRKLSKAGISALNKGSKYIIKYDKLAEIYFYSKNKMILEIGFGDGENLISSAKKIQTIFT